MAAASSLGSIARAHRRLIVRARRTRCRCAGAVLNLGAAASFHAAFEDWLAIANRLLDREVVEDLAAGRRRLADDLDLLESLSESEPGSDDVETLTETLLGRLLALLEREERVLYQPLLRIDAYRSRTAQQEEKSRCSDP